MVHNPGETGGERYHGDDCFDAVGAGDKHQPYMDAWDLFGGDHGRGLCPRFTAWRCVGLKGRMPVVSRWSLVVGYLWSGWSSS